MPNWVSSSVTVQGSKEDLTAFIERGTQGYTVTHNDAERARENKLSLLDPGPYYVGMLSFGAFFETPDNYASNWYDLNIERFGTKWDIHVELDLEGDNAIQELNDGNYLICFQMETAWDFPDGGLTAWSEAFPNLIFLCDVTEEGNFFAGVCGAKGGAIYQDFFDPEDAHEEAGIAMPDDEDDPDVDMMPYWEACEEAVQARSYKALLSMEKFLANLEKETSDV